MRLLNKIKNIIIIIALLLSTTACHTDKRFYPVQQKQRVDAIKAILIEDGLADEKQDIVKYPKIAEHMILGEFALGMTKAETNCVNTLHHYRKKNSIDNKSHRPL